MAVPNAALRPPTRPDVQPDAGRRVAGLDLFKGAAILAVVLIHVSGNALGRLEPGSGRHLALALANRSLQFAVPAFLFLIALVQTRSVIARPQRLRDYYRVRFGGTLLSYLVWSVLYGLFAVAINPSALAGETFLERYRDWVLGGGAYYHLYFLAVALQLYAVLPALTALARRRPPVLASVLVLVALQIGWYWLNRLQLRTEAPGSLLPSYLLPVGLGLIVGARLPEWTAFWNRWRLPILAATAAALAAYLPLAYDALLGTPVNTFAYSLAMWAFWAGASLLLFGACLSLGERRPNGILRLLGLRSLQVYLIHPAAIVLLNRVEGFPASATPAGFAALFALAVAAPVVVATIVGNGILSRLLFGR